MSEDVNLGGKPKLGKFKNEKTIRINPHIPESVYNRMIQYCEEEERYVQWVVTKALDTFLESKGY